MIRFLYLIGRSPIFAHTNSTISGLTTIRAYKSNETLIREFNSLQDSNTSVCFVFNSSSRALALWLELICVLYMTIVIAIFFVFEKSELVWRLFKCHYSYGFYFRYSWCSCWFRYSWCISLFK